eukprot:510315_1
MTATLRTAHILEEHGCHRCVKCQKNFSREATFKWHIRKSLCGLNRNPKRTSKSEKEVFHKDPKGGNDVFIKQEHEISVEPTTQQQIRCSVPSQSAQPSQTVSSSESSKPISNSIARPVSPLVERLKVEKPPTNSEKPSAKTIPNVNTRTENSDGLVCNNCSQSFSAGSYLKKHLKSCVNVSRGKFVCAECSVTCKSRSDMDKHMLQCHGGYKCETCVSDRRYTAWKNLKAHLSKNICNATRFQCPQCDLKFMTATLRTAHILEEHGCHRCVKCQKNFSREATFKWHIRKSLCALNR